MRRIVSIWFRHLVCDWKMRREPALKHVPFVMAAQERNRSLVKAVNHIARSNGIALNMVVADARSILPELQVLEYVPGQQEKLLEALGEWCIRYTPHVTVDLPDGLLLDASGCTHLWSGEKNYLEDIVKRLHDFGYTVHAAIADTAGAAWGLCRFAPGPISVVPAGGALQALSPLPPAALQLDETVCEKFRKLGLEKIGDFITMPSTALRRRFGQLLLTRIHQALGSEMELLEPIHPVAPYEERLPCIEPIRTAPAIAMALQNLLETLCERLNRESKGLRKCELRAYRLDGNIQKIAIGTNAPSRNVNHLFRLFETRIAEIEPDLGIELFVLSAAVVEELSATQDALWTMGRASEKAFAELQDRLAGKLGAQEIQCYVPEECHWPERSVKKMPALVAEPGIPWRLDLPRPSHLLLTPERVEVSVPLPDYPPMLFIHRGRLYNITKADGPERIEQEWWKQKGLYRDYYCVEDERGERYWLFRSGDYKNSTPKWFLHGFFS